MFHKNDVVVDVGAAPGGWSEYAVKRVGITAPCSVLSIDLLPIAPILGVHCIQGDFLDAEMKRLLLHYIDGRRVNTVLSDIAPNFAGDHSIDHERQAVVLVGFYE